MARLHVHAQKWDMPKHFERPLLDADELTLSLDKLKGARDGGRISEGHFAVLLETANKIQKLYLRGQIKKKDWGLIHQDLMVGNCLWHRGEIRPIDFDNCEFGYYLYDMAWVFNALKPEYRRRLLEGYEQASSLPQDIGRRIEAFMIMSRLRHASWWVGNQNHRFEDIPEFVQNFCEKFIDGDAFVFWD